MNRAVVGVLIACLLLAACTGESEGITPPPQAMTQPPPSPFPSAIATSPAPAPSVAPMHTHTPPPTVTETLAGQTPGASAPAPVDTPTLASLGSLAPITPENVVALAQVGGMLFSPWELVTSLAWSPDGGFIALAAGERVYLFDVQAQETITALQVGALTHSLAFSPNGAWLAAGSRDGRLRLWDVPVVLDAGHVDTGSRLALEAHKKGVNSVAFSPLGAVLASGGNDAVARFWDPVTGDLVGSVIGGTFAVPAIAFVPGANTLAVVNGDVVRLRDVDSESILGTFYAQTSLYSLAFSPDGALLAASDTANLVRLWDPSTAFRTGSERYPDATVLEGHQGRVGSYQALVWRVAFSPDGRILASAGGDATIRLWDPAGARLLLTLQVHTKGVTCVAFSPDGRVLASGGLDGALRLWGVAE